MGERFELTDSVGKVLIVRSGLGKIMLWLSDNSYFVDKPDAVLVLTEEHIKKEMFSVKIMRNTTLDDLKTAWESFERGL